MIALPRSGWQTLIADLSIILFMMTAGSLSHTAPPPPTPSPLATPAVARPFAVWRDAPGAPSLGEWLAAQPRDPRQQLTIVVHDGGGGGGGERALAARLTALLAATRQAGVRTRVIAESGPRETTAGLAFDAQ